jgi:carbohydrate-selective porin OprB
MTCQQAPIEIGNLVWEDTDGNGIQDPDESGIAGVTVELRDPNNGNAVLATAVTDSEGRYFFKSLRQHPNYYDVNGDETGMTADDSTSDYI